MGLNFYAKEEEIDEISTDLKKIPYVKILHCLRAIEDFFKASTWSLKNENAKYTLRNENTKYTLKMKMQNIH